MKHLSQFSLFDWEAFSKDKAYMALGQKPWTDNGKQLGTRLETVIAKDDTAYSQKDGEHVTNRYEKITFKVKKVLNIPENTFVLPVNAVAKVYGEYRNQLSVVCDDIKISQTQRSPQ